ncbi:MAG TPA: AAA family ATPase, partial [Acidimicrobiales bacterium]
VGAVMAPAASPRATATPWVGRDGELAVLEAALAAARAGDGRTVEVIAEPGMGKTRLIDEVVARHPEATIITVACGQYAMSTPYFALRSLLRRVAGVEQDASPTACGERLTAWIVEAAPALEPWLPLIAIPFDAVVPPTPEADRIDPAFRRQRMHAAVLDLLAATLPHGGIVRVEDAHWLDDASRDLLADLVVQIGSHPWLAIVTRRPGPRVLTEVASTTTIELAPLAADHAARLAGLLIGDDGTLSDRDLQLLVERGGGNPLFTAELAGAAAAQGSAEELPDSVEAVLMSRIDTLEPAARRRLREASVLGMVVEPRLVATATGDPDLRDPRAWQALEAFLEPLADGALRFRHALFRQAAYDGLSYRRRRQLHGDIGNALEAAATDQLDEVAGLLAIHFHRARQPDKAWTFSVRAGELARAKYANVEAADMLTQALDVANAAQVEHTEIARVAEALGDVSELAARYDRAWVAYNVARRWAPDRGGRARLAWKQGIVREREGQYVAALQWFRRALELFEAGGSDEERIAAAEVRLAYAGVRYRQARYSEAVRWARRAAEEAEDLDNRPVLAHACYLLELAFLSWPQPEAARYQGRALPMLEEIGDLVSQAKVLNNLGIAAYRRGDWATAVETYGRAVAAAEAGGAVVFEVMAVFNLAEVRADQGYLDEAEALLRRARRAWRSARYAVGIGVATLHLGRIAARAGRTEEALELIDAARVRFEGLHAADFVLEARVRMVECLQLAGRFEEAKAAADAAAADAHSINCDPILWSALQRHRAVDRLVRGDEPGARPLLEDSLRRAEDAGAPYERAQTLLVMAEESARQEAEAILARLAVVAGPWIPATPADRTEETAPCGT